MVAQPSRGRRAAVCGAWGQAACRTLDIHPAPVLAGAARPLRTWMTGAGLARPVVSMMMASNLLRRFSSLLTVLIRSPRTATHQVCGAHGACTHLCDKAAAQTPGGLCGSQVIPSKGPGGAGMGDKQGALTVAAAARPRCTPHDTRQTGLGVAQHLAVLKHGMTAQRRASACTAAGLTCAADAAVVELKDLLLGLHHQRIINAHLRTPNRQLHAHPAMLNTQVVQGLWCGDHAGTHCKHVPTRPGAQPAHPQCMSALLRMLTHQSTRTSPNSFSMTAIFLPWLPAGTVSNGALASDHRHPD